MKVPWPSGTALTNLTPNSLSPIHPPPSDPHTTQAVEKIDNPSSTVLQHTSPTVSTPHPQPPPFNKSQQTSPLHILVTPLPIASICQFCYNKKMWPLNPTPILQYNTKHNHAISPITREHEKQWLTHPLRGQGGHASQIVRQPTI